MGKATVPGAALAVVMMLAACSQPGRSGEPGERASGAGTSPIGARVQPDGTLALSKRLTLKSEGGLNSTVAVDPKSGTVFMSWAEETAPGEPRGEREDGLLRAVVARSDDGGKTFGEPVVASAAGDRVSSSTVAPTRVAVGPAEEVYLLYGHDAPGADPAVFEYGRNVLRVVRSDDRGQSFGAPVDVAPAEPSDTTMSMSNLFVAPGGDVYVSWLDDREQIAYKLANQGEPAGEHDHDEEAPTQLRMARSSDGGRSFGPSVLVQKPVCACCGTQMAEGKDSPLYITTRSEETGLKDSYDAVRDLFVSASTDEGKTWSPARKVHDDGFKVSGCPDVTSGLVVDEAGRIHAAWYTGTERGAGPGVYYAVSGDGGGTFSRPVALLDDTWVPYSDVKLAVDHGGHAWVAFEDRRGDEDQVVVARLGPNGRLELSKAWPGSAPDIAAVGDQALVTWNTLPSVAEGEHVHNPGGGISALVVSSSTGR